MNLGGLVSLDNTIFKNNISYKEVETIRYEISYKDTLYNRGNIASIFFQYF